MKFIRFENRLIHLEAIASCHYSPRYPLSTGAVVAAEIEIQFVDGRSLTEEGENADRLWAMLCETIAAAAAADNFASLAATAIMSDFGRNGGESNG